MQAGDLDECFFPFASAPVSAGPETLQCEMEAIPFNPVQSWLKHESSQGEGFSPASTPHPDPKHLLHEGGRRSFVFSSSPPPPIKKRMGF